MNETSQAAADAPAKAFRVLVADDQKDVLEALRLLLKGAGYETETVESPAAVLHAIGQTRFDLILIDMNYSRDTTSGVEGLALLGKIRNLPMPPPVMVMTAWSDVELAVEAMQRGASDFVQKPWNNRKLLASVEKQVTSEQQRTMQGQRANRELEIARNVQQKLLPQHPPVLRTAEMAGRCVPAYAIGGDYFDFLDTGAGSASFLLADVSGKGIAAAMLMANLQGLFRSHLSLARRQPGLLLEIVNEMFHGSTPPEQYATAFYASYDDDARRLTWTNCGHVRPLLLRANGAVERLNSGSTVLGLFPRWECETQTTTLQPGDLLVVTSDGVQEAGAANGDEFGEQRLLSTVFSVRHKPVQFIVDTVVEAAQSFTAGPQGDDITALALRAR